MPDETLTVALVQTYHGRPTDEALRHAADAIREAANAGARLVAFSETYLPGYPAWLDVCRDAARWDHASVKQVYRRLVEASVTVPGDEVEALCDAARESEVTLVVGVSERIASGPGSRTLYNTLLTIGPTGRLLNHHRKLMPTFSERMVWGTGDDRGLRAVDTPAGRVGGLICWEHWMPLARQALHEDGEDVHVAAWPTVKEMNLLCCRHYAFEARCFVLAVGGLMTADGLSRELEAALPDDTGDFLLRGGSCIVGPDGQLVTQPVYDREAIIYATPDLGRIAEEAMTFDAAGHYSRPDCLRLERRGDGPGERR